MDFGATISRAIRITWDYKVLWILGFLAALGSGGAGGLGQSPQSTFRFNNAGQLPPGFRELGANPNAILAGAAVLGCLLFILSIVLLVIGIIARGGLIAGVQQIESDGNTTFGRSWSAGSGRFWQMLGLNILLWLPLIVLIVILAVAFGGTLVAAIAAGSAANNDNNGGAIAGLIGGGLIVLCCVLCVLVLYALVAEALQTFGERAIVVENLGVTEALGRAWALFRANLGNIILLALVMLVISIVFAAITGALIAIVLLPTLFPVFTEIGQNGALSISTTILAIIGVVIATILGAIINALYVTFNSSTWTLAYRQFTGAAPAISSTTSVQPPLPAA